MYSNNVIDSTKITQHLIWKLKDAFKSFYIHSKNVIFVYYIGGDIIKKKKNIFIECKFKFKLKTKYSKKKISKKVDIILHAQLKLGN